MDLELKKVFFFNYKKRKHLDGVSVGENKTLALLLGSGSKEGSMIVILRLAREWLDKL